MGKRLVVICDDQQRFIEQFCERHRQHYDIIIVNDTRELPKVIERLRHFPDLVLLDLYHPKDVGPDFEGRRLEAEASLSELDRQIEETNQAVLGAWEPRGLEVLKLLRQKYSPEQLPIVVYTQKGLLLLDDSQLREAEQYSAHWLLKKKLSARTEEIRIDRIIMADLERPRRAVKRATRVYRWSLVVSWLIIGVLASRMIFNTTQFKDVIANIIGALIGAIVALLATPWLEELSRSEK
jgi:CheY-like chemotaxis protein